LDEDALVGGCWIRAAFYSSHELFISLDIRGSSPTVKEGSLRTFSLATIRHSRERDSKKEKS
jgi:hypothetical protein